MTGRIPARLVTGGEGVETGEQEEVKAHLMVCLDGSGTVGGGGSAASRVAAAEVQRRRSTATVLRRWIGGAEESGSCVRLGQY